MYDVTPDAGMSSSLYMGTWDILRFHAQALLKLESPIVIEVNKDGTQATITSPISSDGMTAVLTKASFNLTTDVFQLKKGKHTYPIIFSDVHLPNRFSHNEETHPGATILDKKRVQHHSDIRKPRKLSLLDSRSSHTTGA